MPAVAAVLVALLCTLHVVAIAAPPPITLQPYVSGLSLPLEITRANDGSGRLFVVEQAGKVRVIKNDQLLATPFLDLSAANGGPVVDGGEEGLLGLAFHPSYATDGRFYVYYTRRPAGNLTDTEVVIERYRRSTGNPEIADPGSGSTLLVIPHPKTGGHNAGKMAFGPDGYLYISVGDGDTPTNGQLLTTLRGKIMRLDVDSSIPYAIPPTNPFVDSGNSIRGEIWAYGFRNPWRFSFDRATGDLLIGDVGHGAWEEVNFEPSGSSGGRNYGWDVFEGAHCFEPPTGCSLPNHTLPIIEYPHGSATGRSVIGGYRYRGGSVPGLVGYYVYGDFVSGRIWAAAPDETGTWVSTQIATLNRVSTFGEDESGELYVANIMAGTILRITPSSVLIPRLANISTRGQALTGDNLMIGGFVIGGGSVSKTVAIVATGPSLAADGGANPLANPTLSLVRMSDQSVIATNDDWQSAANAAQIQASGLAPSDPLESAILMNLSPGAYSAIISGAGGGTGVGLVSVYEVSQFDVPLINISTRGRVGTDFGVMIGGFIIQGIGSQTVAIRALGPSLASQGVGDALQNPKVRLVRMSDSTVIGTNDDWGSAANAGDITASGFAPSDPFESAILTTLAPGAYTVIIEGVSGSTGVGLFEVYRVGP